MYNAAQTTLSMSQWGNHSSTGPLKPFNSKAQLPEDHQPTLLLEDRDQKMLLARVAMLGTVQRALVRAETLHRLLCLSEPHLASPSLVKKNQ